MAREHFQSRMRIFKKTRRVAPDKDKDTQGEVIPIMPTSSSNNLSRISLNYRTRRRGLATAETVYLTPGMIVEEGHSSGSISRCNLNVPNDGVFKEEVRRMDEFVSF